MQPEPPPLYHEIAPPPILPAAGVDQSHVLCTTCGYDLSGTAIGGHCPECGAAVAQSLRPHRTPATSGYAVGSLVCGVVGLGACPLVGIVAVPLYFMAMKEVRAGTAAGGSKGLAIAGLVTGCLSLLISAIFLIFLVATGF